MVVCNNNDPHGSSHGEQLQKAFRMLQVVEEKGVPVSRDILYSILQECIKHKHLSAGETVHSLLVCRGLESASCFSDHLIRLFATCNSLPEANHVFESVACPTTHTWIAIISAHVNHGQNERALDLYNKLLHVGASATDCVTVLLVLKACSALGAIEQGRVVHSLVLEEFFLPNVMIMNTLVDMYAKSDGIQDAHCVFDGLPDRNVVSWGAMVCGYSELGYGARAIELFAKMQFEGLEPSRAIFLSVLKACSATGNVNQGRQLHDCILRSTIGSDLRVESTLVDMYAKCGSLDEAHAVFSRVETADVVAWGAMISGLVDNGQGEKALQMYKEMKKTDVEPNIAIFLSLSKACSSVGKLEYGVLLHEEIIKAQIHFDLALQTGLIDMYSQCGSFEKARQVFDTSLDRDSLIWRAIIVACIQHGHEDCAVTYFKLMIAEGISLEVESYLSLLKACHNGSSSIGRFIHEQIIRGGGERGVALGSALVDMYNRFGCVEEARHVFDQLQERNVISWGSLIAGYVQQELDISALALFSMMLEHGINPDKATLSCILKACCGAGAIQHSRNIHNIIIRNNFESDGIVTSSLVDMYARCGSLDEACKVFDGAACQDVVLWGVIIGACCLHGNLNLAAKYLKGMEGSGLRPINATFSSMLAACCYSGRLEEGHKVFNSMREDYCIMPDEEHYSCMVDLLSRAGCLVNAQTLLQSSPYQPDIIMGTSFLTGCKTYGNMEMGTRCFEKASEVDWKGCPLSRDYSYSWMRGVVL